MKKVFAILLCLLMIFSLCACGEEKTEGKEANGTVATTEAPIITEEDGLTATVTVGHDLSNAQVESINHWLQPFDARFPDVEVVFKRMDGPITAENAPTVLLCEPDEVPGYVEAGLLMDLNNWIDSRGMVVYHGTSETHPFGLSEDNKEDMEALFYEEGKIPGDDATWMLPVMGDILTIYYNSTIFEEKGLLQSPALSWEELQQVCQELKKMDPDAVPLAVNEVDETFISLCAQQGLSFTADQWKSLFGEEAKAIAKQLNEMYQKGYLTTTGQRGSIITLQEQADTPRSYMAIGSSEDVQMYIPSLENDAYAYEVNVMTMPRLAGESPMPLASSRGLAICKSDDDNVLTAAWLLVKFMSTEAEFQGGLAKDTGSLPTVKSAWMTEEYGHILNEANGGSGLSGVVALLAQDQDSYRFTAQAFPGSAEIREQIAALIEQCITFTGDVDTQIAAAFESTLAACTE